MVINPRTGHNGSNSGVRIRSQKSERPNKALDIELLWPKSYSFPRASQQSQSVTGSISETWPFSKIIEKLKTQYKFIQVKEISTFLRYYPFLIADLNTIYEVKSRHFDESPMDLYYISETGSLESATLAAYIKINAPIESMKDIFSCFDKEWWNNISKEAKTLLMVDMIKNV